VGTYCIDMYIEKRKFKSSTKYYLIHSYREGNKVNKIRKYLGKNLGEADLVEAKKRTEKLILQILKELNTEVFSFTLTKSKIKQLNNLNKNILVQHLDAKEWEKFTQDFIYNTNAIEGSTVKRDEVPEILEKSKAENDEEIETKGVAKAVEYIKSSKEELSIGFIKKLHKLCFEGSKVFAGELRNVEVVIRDFKGEIIHQGFQSSQVKPALEDMAKWYEKNKSKFKPIVLAAIIHNQFEHIHPFQDGNGRIGRLLLNYILLSNNYPPINVLLEDRKEYYLALRKYSKEEEIKPMVEFLIKQYKKTLKNVATKSIK